MSSAIAPARNGAAPKRNVLHMLQRMAQFGAWNYLHATGRMRWSDELCRLLGLPSGSAPSLLEATACYAQQHRARMSRLLDECLLHGRSFDEQAQILHASGEIRWVRVLGEAVRESSGQISGARGIVQDIERQKQLEDDADRLAERFTNTLESITDAFYTVDREWRFTYVNREAERLLQRSRAQLMGRGLWEEFPDLATRPAHMELRRAMERNSALYLEEHFADTDSWYEVRAYPSEEGLTVYYRDITEARRNAEALRLSEQRFQTVTRAITDSVYDFDLVSGKLWRSENMRSMFGYTSQDFEGGLEGWVLRLHPEDRGRMLESMQTIMAGTSNEWAEEYRFQRADGSYAYVLDRAILTRDENGQVIRTVGALMDLSERRLAQEMQRLADARIQEQAALLDKARDAIVVCTLDNVIRYWNKGAERLYGWTLQEAIGSSLAELLYEDPQALGEATAQVLASGEWSSEVLERHKDGRILQVEVNWTLVRDEQGQPKHIFAIKSDISRRKQSEQKIRQLAFYDTLTGLPNRQMLMDRLQANLEREAYRDCMGALLFIDLDNFKTLNDTLGHAYGDMLLQQVAQRLLECVRGGDLVARLGGDEFVVVLENLDASQELASQQARMVGLKILAALNRPFQLQDHQHYAPPSIGVTLLDDHQRQMGELLKRADLAMYQAKAGGRNTLRFYEPQMQAAISSRAVFEADMRRALEQGEFKLVYQPQVDQDSRVVGAEALLRWHHPERGLILPADFIGRAEETGLIWPLGQWALENACAELARWQQDAGMAGLDLSVNVSVRQFHHPHFVERVLAILRRTGANPRRLKLELTESMLLKNFDDTIAKMRTLKARGIGFCLDDFGAGYSSLTYLRRLPLDVLKIDGAFIRDLMVDSHNLVIARTIIALGRGLGLQVIAEGVYNRHQRQFLSDEGCQLIQGFLISEPLEPARLREFVRDIGQSQ